MEEHAPATPPPHPLTPGANIPPAPGQNPPAPAGKPQPQASGLTIQRAAPGANPAAVPPPTQALGKQQFIAAPGQAPSAGMAQLREQRHETREGDRVFIREPDRTIIEENNRTIIRHNDVDRFAVDARDVHVERNGNQTVSVVVRPDGVQIVDTEDSQGHLLRRVRRDPDGRQFVIIDNGFAGAALGTIFLNIPPPVIRVPRDRYIVDADAANEADIYDVLIAPPVDPIDQRYTLDQIRYNEALRDFMPRVDLDINFDTGSWQLTPDQVDRLSLIADAINRAIGRNPREVFLIEGHTDAVGSDIDNLSLSDRRAEAVAVALTEQFQVPPENLVTQGYGKEGLKIQTGGAERANRRVAIRRITPLLDQDAGRP
jgi:outer membrane protein OmpA-like peptidoglycan-associated protein